jgi:hypothetical protein
MFDRRMRVEKTPMQTLASQLSFDQGLREGRLIILTYFFMQATQSGWQTMTPSQDLRDLLKELNVDVE